MKYAFHGIPRLGGVCLPQQVGDPFDHLCRDRNGVVPLVAIGSCRGAVFGEWGVFFGSENERGKQEVAEVLFFPQTVYCGVLS